MDPLNWRAQASCLTADPEAFFPGRESGYKSPVYALRVCEACPVLEICRYETFDEPHGVTGGLSENQRRKMKRADLKPPLPGTRLRHPGHEGQAPLRVALAGEATA